MSSNLPKYCHRNENQLGNKFIRFRKGTFSTYLTGKPWSEDFMRQYADALNGIKRAKNLPFHNFWNHVDKSSGPNNCWRWTKQIDALGYGRVAVPTANYKYRGDNVLTHRHAWTLIHGPIPKGMHILHSCDNPACCNPAHLFIGTHADNMRDRNLKGRQYSKITEAEVRKIRSSHAQGIYQTTLAKLYGLHVTQISLICRRKVWKHVT